MASDVNSYIFENSENIHWKPGQYLIYSLSHKPQDLRGKMRFFTISSSPFENKIQITTRINKQKRSSFKNALDGLKIGETIEAKGPDGDFVLANLGKNYVFIAGGIGITPFRSIIAELDNKQKTVDITLIYANKNADIPFKSELDEIAAKRNEFKILYVISPKRINTSYLKKNIIDFKSPIFYISGPDPMVEEMADTLKNLKVPKEHIREDYFSGYREI